MRFRTAVELGGKTATGLRVPDEVVAGLGTRKRVPVRVTIGTHTYRTTVAPYGGHFMVPLSADNRKRAGVTAGDDVDVDIEVDDSPREVDVPADLVAALAADADAQRTFDALSFSHKQQHVLAIEGAKTPETRQRRIAKAVEVLRT